MYNAKCADEQMDKDLPTCTRATIIYVHSIDYTTCWRALLSHPGGFVDRCLIRFSLGDEKAAQERQV